MENKTNTKKHTTKQRTQMTGLEIAIIGMTGRFPGSENIDQFWNNLKNGIEGISFFTEEELKEQGINPELLKNPNYIRANALIKNKEYFDPTFFGYTPREAEVMHPQMRLFHESAWHALEDAGYDPDSYKGSIGLYAGSTNCFNWQTLSVISGASNILGGFAKDLLHNSDLICHRVSFKLNLRGPSVTVFSACSTSLVAIHLACRALVTGECSMALAGGVSISMRLGGGYIYEEGMIKSPDGHCRAFDAKAKGTVFGDGIGTVVLKRAKEAMADGDNIYALVKGSAINNDGMNKVDFPAPSVKGQVGVIRMAQKLARVKPESITYIEAHGTGTTLGDPIEITALKKAFTTDKRNYCGIGTVKSNIGHLDAAAGVTGLIKVALALQNRYLPPSLHYEKSNPNIDFEDSPFYVVKKPKKWENDEYPLRAGISSFGIGGTNVHVILEEPPEPSHPSPQSETSRQYQLLLLSAKTKKALEEITENLIVHLKEQPEIPMADVAFTLQQGRKAFQHRKMLVCRDTEEAVDLLTTPDSPKVQAFTSRGDDQEVIFMFPGQGAQYGNMGIELYKKEAIFKEEMDRCFNILEPLMGKNIKEIIFSHLLTSLQGGPEGPPVINTHPPAQKVRKSERTQGFGLEIPKDSDPGGPGNRDEQELGELGQKFSDERVEGLSINDTEITQPVLFIFEYALAKLLMSWGIEPCCMIGHSIGEYVAAHLSGVITLEDALKLVVLRGKLMQGLPRGSMLSVTITVEEITPHLTPDLSLAAINSPSICVVSGEDHVVEDFQQQMQRRGFETRLLHTSHAFHSKMMEPMLQAFEEEVRKIEFKAPQISYISNVTGKKITEADVTDPSYWTRHLRETVYFSKGITMLLQPETCVFLEVGPGKALSSFVRQHKEKKPGHYIVNLVRHPKETVADDYFLFNKIGQLWLYGKKLNWQNFYAEEQRVRVPLPKYPFQGQKFWLDEKAIQAETNKKAEDNPLRKKADMTQWIYLPTWERSHQELTKPADLSGKNTWLIFKGNNRISEQLRDWLLQQNQEVICVEAGSEYLQKNQAQYSINPAHGKDYELLFKDLGKASSVPLKILHLWSLYEEKLLESGLENLDTIMDLGLNSLLYLAQAMGTEGITDDIQVGVITNGLTDVLGTEKIRPVKATLMGAVKVIPLEYPNLSCRTIDIQEPVQGTEEDQLMPTLLVKAFFMDTPEVLIPIRGIHSWTRRFKTCAMERLEEVNHRLKESGTYLITGGLGGVGYTLAEFLARATKAKLVLTGRTQLPSQEERETWLKEHPEEDEISGKIKKLLRLEKIGAQYIYLAADVSDQEAMKTALAQAKEQMGKIDGVIHAAGEIDYAGVIQRRTKEMTQESMAARVKGTLVLEKLMAEEPPQLVIQFSSMGNVLYKDRFAQLGYIASNEFLEAYAEKKQRNRNHNAFTLTINWCDWLEVGMVLKAVTRMRNGDKEKVKQDMTIISEYALNPLQGIDLFNRILDHAYPRVLISPKDLEYLFQNMKVVRPGESAAQDIGETASPENYYDRPELTTPYVAPRNSVEKKLSSIFQRFLGLKKVGVLDDFFELGGNSLIAMTAIAMIHKELNVKMPLAELFNRPVIESLAQYIMGSEENVYVSIQPIEKKEYYPLSAAQRRLYIVWEMNKLSTNYNQPKVTRLEGKINLEILDQVFLKVIERHEALRTSIEVVNGDPVQRIHPMDEVKFKVELLEGTEEMTKEMVDDFVRSFDLGVAPMIRVGLLKTGEDKYVLIMDLHHIATDGVSNTIIINELVSFDQKKPLPLLRLQYKEYAEWQYRSAQDDTLKKQREYWLKEFEGELPVLNLPTDFSRGSQQSFEGKLIGFEFTLEQTIDMDQLVQQEGATMFLLSLAMITILLSKISGQKDVVVGTPSAGRGHADLEYIVGMFINTLALRNFPNGEKTFREFLSEVKERTLRAFENQDFQFEDLADAVILKRDMSRNPLFDVMLVYQTGGLTKNEKEIEKKDEKDEKNLNPEENQKKKESLSFKPYNYITDSTRFDLIFHGFIVDEKLYFTLNFCTELFKEERAEMFAQYFRDIVSLILEDPDRKISDISILKKDEREEILSQFSEDLFNE